MATFAARRLQSMVANTAPILGTELLAAAQGIEFLRPLQARRCSKRRTRSFARAARRYRPTAHSRPTSRWSTALVSDGSLSRVFRALPALPALWVPA